jgi:hypothetical protein
MRKLLVVAGLCAAGTLVLATSGLAGQPVTQTLNPPPPAYETCKAVGDGTICQGTTDISYGPIDTADEGPPLVCVSDLGIFDVFDSAVGNSTARRIYDANGDLVKRFRYDQITAGWNINPLTGAKVPYTSTLTNVDVFAVPGDLGSTTLTTSGNFIVRPPHGAPVFVINGRTVLTFEPDFTIDFMAGHLDLFAYALGDTSVLEPLCNALGGRAA